MMGHRAQLEYTGAAGSGNIAACPVGATPQRPRDERQWNVDQTKWLDQLSAIEQRELCAWSYSFVDLRLAPPRPHGFSAMDSAGSPDDRRSWAIRTLNWHECLRKLPRCDVPIGKVIPCVEAVQRVTSFLSNQPAECKALWSCVWGFELREMLSPAP